MNLFVYGTLLIPRIWETVTGGPDLDSASARLPGHRIYRVKEVDFPGIVADPGAPDPVPGRVIFDLPTLVVERLDDYEGPFYRRERVEVETEAGTVAARAYRVPPAAAPSILSGESWTLEWFEREAAVRYWAGVFGD